MVYNFQLWLVAGGATNNAGSYTQIGNTLSATVTSSAGIGQQHGALVVSGPVTPTINDADVLLLTVYRADSGGSSLSFINSSAKCRILAV